LEASSRIAAQRAFGLLLAALAATDGHAGFEIEDAIVIPADRRKLYNKRAARDFLSTSIIRCE
jgi:hypothetical protein